MSVCPACNGSGYYDHNGSPKCGQCKGTGKWRKPAAKANPIIRVGDTVRIVNPRIVTRVGYPKTVQDYVPDAERQYRIQLQRDMSEYCVKKAITQIAYGLAKKDGFGGRSRSLHFAELPEARGQTFQVESVRSVKTGTYYPSWSNHEEFEPGGLNDAVTHRLVTGWGFFFPGLHQTANSKFLNSHFLSTDLEKVAQ